MAGSVNKVNQCLHDTKVCERCGDAYSRKGGLSAAQWLARSYCSKSCASQKTSLCQSTAKRLYESGKSSCEIAVDLKISAVHVRRILRSAGVCMRDASTAMIISHARVDVKARMSKAQFGRTHSEAAKEKLRSITGPDHPLWSGGITAPANGYVAYTSSPANGGNAGRSLHRVVAERMAGRNLASNEHVHHRDGDKHNNAPENLQIMSASDHARHHAIKSNLGVRKNA